MNSEKGKTIISKCIKNNVLVDSTIINNNEKLIFIIQFKYTSNPSTEFEDQLEVGYPDKWFKQISKVKNFKKLKGYKVINIFITNANIPKKANEIIHSYRNAIVIDQSVSKSFFSLNIFPYVSSVVQ